MDINPFDAILAEKMRDDVRTEAIPKNASYSLCGRLVEITSDYYRIHRWDRGKMVQDMYILKDQVAAITFYEDDPSSWVSPRWSGEKE